MNPDSRSLPLPGAATHYWGPRLLWTLAFAGLALLAGFTVWFCIQALAYPYQLLYGEGFMLEFARRLAAGVPLYKPLAEFPLGTVNYPPLALLLARIAFPVAGFGYAAGRIWAFLAALAVAGTLATWLRRSSEHSLSAMVAALAWLGAPYVYDWAPQFRADLLGLAFSLSGVYVAWRGWGTRALYAAAPLFVLGLYCKQSFVAAPLATGLAVLLARRPRQALVLAGLTLFLGGVPFVALSVATKGAFWESLVTANIDPFHWDRLAMQLRGFLLTYLPLLLLAVVGAADTLVNGWRAPKPHAGTGPERLIVSYMSLAMLTAILAGKAGSWENYFLEPLAAVCLGAGLGLPRLWSWPAGRWLAPALLVLQVGLMWHTPTKAVAQMRADAASNRALGPLVAAAPGVVMSEDAGLLLQAGKPVPYYDFQLSQLALAGRWDQHWEVDNLRQGAFPLVIFEDTPRLDVDRYGRYTRSFMSALDYAYRPAARIGKYLIYRPAPLGRERTARFGDKLALVGHTFPPTVVQPGTTLSMDVVWQATRAMTETYTSFLHLVDAANQGHAGHDRQPWDGLYPTSRWAEGEMVRMSYTLTLPADLPPGLYTLNTGWYDASHDRLRTPDGANRARLAEVVVPDPTQPPEPTGLPLDASFENGVVLLGYDVVQGPDSIRVSLSWQTDRPLDLDFTVFVHLRDGQGTPVAQGDGPPLAGSWLSSLWPMGYRLSDIHTVPLPALLPHGRYELVAGLYDPPTGRRVALKAGGDEVPLGLITIR
jgi:hypothetical protein